MSGFLIQSVIKTIVSYSIDIVFPVRHTVRAHPPLAPTYIARAHGHLQKGTHSIIGVLLTCVAPQLHVRLSPPPSSVGRLLKCLLVK